MILAPHSASLVPTNSAISQRTTTNVALRLSNRVDVANSSKSIPAGLSENDSLDLSDASVERMALSLRTHVLTKQEDGDLVRVDGQTKLRFKYDFQAADGTKIQIRLKVNSQFSQSNNGTDEAQSLKLRVRVRVSVVQEQVGSGVGPLLDENNPNAGPLDSIAKALELFQQLTDAASSAFEASDPLDGDSLIANLVGAFNELSDSVLGSFLGLPGIPGTESSSDNPVSDASVGLPPTIPPAGELPPHNLADVAPPPESTASPEPAAESSPNSDLPIASEPVADEPAQTTADVSQPVTARVVLIKLRTQVMQSLKSLADEFNSQPRSSSQSNDPSANILSQFYSQQLSIRLISQTGTQLNAQA